MCGIVAMHQALHQAFRPSEIYGASLRVTQALLSFIYFRMKRSIIKKMFWHKNGTSKPQNGLGFNTYPDIEPNLRKKNSLKFYRKGARVSSGPKTAKNGLWKS